MNKKQISFGKISLNIAKTEEEKKSSDQSENVPEPSGFGKFSKSTEVSTSSKNKEISDSHKPSNKNAKKKAMSINIEEMMEQARIHAQEIAKKTANQNDLNDDKVLEQDVGKSSEEIDDEDDDIIGPPLPPGFSETKPSQPDDEEDIGPPVPPDLGSKTQKEDGDSYDELSDSDDEDPVKDIPNSHEVVMHHGNKAVLALAVDPSGARLATGSIDYDVSFWDFAGMDSSLRSFRTLQPCENHPVVGLQYSATGDSLLVIAGAAQAKVLDRDGFQVIECVKGDQYITDMAMTKGHTASLTSGCWHPHTREEFLTASRDGTVRVWNVSNPRSHVGIMKMRRKGGGRTVPTAVSYRRDHNALTAGSEDGSVQLWDRRSRPVAPAVTVIAHSPGVITSVSNASSRPLTISRSEHGDLKLWDLRAAKTPLAQVQGLESRYDTTECSFSPDDKMIFSPNKGEVIFYNDQLQELNRLEVSKTYVIRSTWHPKLNQLFFSCADGVVKCYYDDKKSLRGAKLCVVKTGRKKQSIEVVSSQQIITPHALPLFRQDKSRTSKKRLEKERLDPVKSHRPDLPITSGQGGRVAASGSTLSSFVIRNLGLSKRVNDEQDPREAILKFAKEAEENPFWVSPAYKSTQPKPIFQTEEGDGETSSKKQKT